MDIRRFQSTFTQMKAEIYKLRAKNKVLKQSVGNNKEQSESIKKENSKKFDSETQTENSYDSKKMENSKKLDAETQTEETYSEKEITNNVKSGIAKYKYFNK